MVTTVPVTTFAAAVTTRVAADAERLLRLHFALAGRPLQIFVGAHDEDALALAERLDAALGDGDSLRAKAERGREDLSKRFGPEAFWAGLQDAIKDKAPANHGID